MKRMLMLAGGCGVATASSGRVGGATFGTGYEQAQAAVAGEPLPYFFFLGKLFASFAAMISGIPGRIFAPSLAIGAGLGSTMSSLFGTSIALGAVLGMAGYFAGIVQAPMTAFVIIMEMTGNHQGVIGADGRHRCLAMSPPGLVSPSRSITSSRTFIAQSILLRRSSAKSEAAPQ